MLVKAKVNFSNLLDCAMLGINGILANQDSIYAPPYQSGNFNASERHIVN